MPTRSLFAHERAYLFDGLNGSYLVIGEHQGDEHCIWSYGALNIFNANQPIVVNWQARHFPSALLHSVADAAHRWMLDFRCDDVATVSLCGFAQPAHGHVVGFSST